MVALCNPDVVGRSAVLTIATALTLLALFTLRALLTLFTLQRCEEVGLGSLVALCNPDVVGRSAVLTVVATLTLFTLLALTALLALRTLLSLQRCEEVGLGSLIAVVQPYFVCGETIGATNSRQLYGITARNSQSCTIDGEFLWNAHTGFTLLALRTLFTLRTLWTGGALQCMDVGSVGG